MTTLAGLRTTVRFAQGNAAAAAIERLAALFGRTSIVLNYMGRDAKEESRAHP
jgi:hypothetical protein